MTSDSFPGLSAEDTDAIFGILHGHYPVIVSSEAGRWHGNERNPIWLLITGRSISSNTLEELRHALKADDVELDWSDPESTQLTVVFRVKERL